MGMVVRNRSFLLMAALILIAGGLLFGAVVAMRVAAAGATNAAGEAGATNNYESSYGLGNTLAIDAKSAQTAAEAAPVMIKVTNETPAVVKEALEAKSPFVIFVYCSGASVDEEMRSYFNSVKSQYSNSAEFFSFEVADTAKLGDTLDQAQVNVHNPPIVIIADGEGEVQEIYTGWVGLKVLEQRLADVLRES